jgi:hypothetical protein
MARNNPLTFVDLRALRPTRTTTGVSWQYPAGWQSFGAKQGYQLQLAPNPPSHRRRVRHCYEFMLKGWDCSQFRPNWHDKSAPFADSGDGTLRTVPTGRATP